MKTTGRSRAHSSSLSRGEKNWIRFHEGRRKECPPRPGPIRGLQGGFCRTKKKHTCLRGTKEDNTNLVCLNQEGERTDLNHKRHTGEGGVDSWEEGGGKNPLLLIL